MFAKLGASARMAQKAEASSARLEAVLSAPRRILEAAARDVTPMIRSMLLGNLAKSGIQSRSGKLRAALGRVEVFLGKGSLVWRFPAGISGYGDSDFYTVAGSLNYGAVHQPQATRPTFDTVTGRVNRFEKRGALGEKAKRTLKSIALGGRANTGSLRVQQNRLGHSRTLNVGTSVKNNTSKSVVIGGAVVVKPHHFNELSDAQKRVVRERFYQSVHEHLRRAARNG